MDSAAAAFGDYFYNVTSAGYAAYVSAVYQARHLKTVKAAAKDDVGFVSTTEAPVRGIPKVRHTSNMLARRGVIIEDLPTRGSDIDPKLQARGIIAEDSIGSYLAARRQCQLALDEIVVQVHDRRRATGDASLQYVDHTFFVGSTDALFPRGTAPDSTVGAPKDVVRASAMYPGVPVIATSTQPTHASGPAPSSASAREVARLSSGSVHSEHGVISDNDDDNAAAVDERQVFDEIQVGELGDSHLVTAFNVLLTTPETAWAGMRHRWVVLPRSYEDARKAVETVALAGHVENLATDVIAVKDALHLDVGAIGVLFFVDGFWSWVIVDDTVPTTSDAKVPLFSSITPKQPFATARFTVIADRVKPVDRAGDSGGAPRPQPTELWPMLVEKAFAKLHRSYDAIDGGLVSEALGALTGGFEFVFNLTVANPDDAGKSTIASKSNYASRSSRQREKLRRAQQVATTHQPNYPEPEPCLVSAVPCVVPPTLGHADRPATTVMVTGEAQRRIVADFDTFSNRVTDREGLTCLAAAKTKASFSGAAAVPADAANVASLIRPGGWPYPIVRSWRSEEDEEGRVEVYDPWSSAEHIFAYNLQLATKARQARVAKLLDDAQRGLRNEQAVRHFATSPLAVRQGSAARFITIKWSTFVTLFDRAEGVHVIPNIFPPAGQHRAGEEELSACHTVMGCARAPRTVKNEGGVLMQDPLTCYVVRIDAPVPGQYHFALQQKDPKLDAADDVNHYFRKQAPFATLALFVYAFDDENPNDLVGKLTSSRTSVGVQSTIASLRNHRASTQLVTTPAAYARQVTASAELSAGYYLVVPVVAKGAATQFVVSVTGPCAAVMKIQSLKVPPIERSVEDDLPPPPRLPIVSPGDLLQTDEAVVEATLHSIRRLKNVVQGVDADQPEEPPLAYVRARKIKLAGGYVSDPKTTIEADGSVSTRRLPRPTDLMVLRLASSSAHSTAEGTAPPAAATEQAQVPPSPSPSPRDAHLVAVASRFLIGDDVESGGSTSEQHVARVCGEAFSEADVLRRGRLTSQRHVEAALGHLLLHGTRLGDALKRACFQHLGDGDAAGLTPDALVSSLLAVLEGGGGSSSSSASRH